MMKRFGLLLLLCLLLCGCAGEAAPEEATTLPPIPETTPFLPDRTGFYLPGSPMENATNGAVRVYPLEDPNVNGLLPLGEGILIFSGGDFSTRLTLLAGETLYPIAEMELNFFLNPEDPTLRRWDDGISFFDPNAEEVVVMDDALREISRIPVPEDCVDAPLLSTDRATLYYCTDTAIRSLDLESGISRVLKEICYSYQSVTGLLLNDTVLECSLSDANGNWKNLYLSTVTGETLQVTDCTPILTSSEDTWYASLIDGPIQQLLFGKPGSTPQVLNTEELFPNCRFLPEANAAVVLTASDENRTGLEYYDLNTGLRTSVITLEDALSTWGFESTGNGQVAFLCYDGLANAVSLYLWDTRALPTGDSQCYTGPYSTQDEPDYEGLAACSLYAEELSLRHGVGILVYQDAVEVQPWDYEFDREHQPRVLMQELELLDVRLQNYPEGFLASLAARYTGLNIALVRGIYGSPESGSLDTARGIQFWEEYEAYLVLSTVDDTEYTLYHELYHLIDTVILNETNAFDQWDLLNPVGFSYDYDYITNQTRNSDEYLREEKRYFIDTYSMSYPKEDRARIVEYAMTEGNESYFLCDTMQAKLKAICVGIRKAFGLKKSPETFLWEQYLKEPLAYTE